MPKSNFYHQGRTNSSKYDQEKAIKAMSTKQIDKLIADYDNDSSQQMKDYIAKLKVERSRRIGKKESVEVSNFSLLTELLELMEFDTPGLKLGALRYDDQENAIYVTIGGQKYKFTPHVAEKVGEIYASVTGMAKHSTGKALAYLKKNATGQKIND